MTNEKDIFTALMADVNGTADDEDRSILDEHSAWQKIHFEKGSRTCEVHDHPIVGKITLR